MKTQFIVTITQTGEKPASPRVLGDHIREVLRNKLVARDSVTVRHVTDEQPETEAPADLVDALRAAHQAGQKAGRMIGKDSWNAAMAYATEAAGK